MVEELPNARGLDPAHRAVYQRIIFNHKGCSLSRQFLHSHRQTPRRRPCTWSAQSGWRWKAPRRWVPGAWPRHGDVGHGLARDSDSQIVAAGHEVDALHLGEGSSPGRQSSSKPVSFWGVTRSSIRAVARGHLGALPVDGGVVPLDDALFLVFLMAFTTSSSCSPSIEASCAGVRVACSCKSSKSCSIAMCSSSFKKSIGRRPAKRSARPLGLFQRQQNGLVLLVQGKVTEARLRSISMPSWMPRPKSAVLWRPSPR